MTQPEITGFRIALRNFEGPFDLLLQLIQSKKMDVTDVALSEVTDEFVAYTRQLGESADLDETTDFLLVAATLLDLKAARLLPRGDVDEIEDLELLESRDLLFARLLQYKAYKQAADQFAVWQREAQRSYSANLAVLETTRDGLRDAGMARTTVRGLAELLARHPGIDAIFCSSDLLALGEQHGSKIWALLDDDELRQLSIVMSSLGTVEASLVENLLLEFVGRLSASGAVLGNYDATERLLQQYLPPERVGGIMDEIRGPAGRNMWEKLANVQEEVLANYLKNEYPQTVAVVLSKLQPEHAARVLAILPEDLALDVVNRMLKMEAVQKEVLERVEQTLRTEFMSSLSQTRRRDAHEVMAEIFNNFDRQTETRFMTSLEEANREAAERIKTLMFTFDDLVRLDAGSAQTLLRNVDKDKLAVALKGATETVRQFFLGNMSSRAAKMLVDDMQSMGPVRLRDVDEAQVMLVNMAKDLAAKGEIIISKTRDEELVY